MKTTVVRYEGAPCHEAQMEIYAEVWSDDNGSLCLDLQGEILAQWREGKVTLLLDEDGVAEAKGRIEEVVNCCICGRSAFNVEDALEKGWLPEFYDGEEGKGPACSECIDKYLKMDQNDGEFVVKQEFVGNMVYFVPFYGEI